MTHEYQFHCKCKFCEKITKHFGLKSEKEARRLGYQIGENTVEAFCK